MLERNLQGFRFHHFANLWCLAGFQSHTSTTSHPEIDSAAKIYSTCSKSIQDQKERNWKYRSCSNNSAAPPAESFVHADGRCALRADYVTFSAFGALFRAVPGRRVTPSKGSSLEPLWLPATVASARQRTFSTSLLKREKKRGGCSRQ